MFDEGTAAGLIGCCCKRLACIGLKQKENLFKLILIQSDKRACLNCLSGLPECSNECSNNQKRDKLQSGV